MNRKAFIWLAISLALTMGFQSNTVLGELQSPKKKDKAEPSKQTTDTITIKEISQSIKKIVKQQQASSSSLSSDSQRHHHYKREPHYYNPRHDWHQ
jgi:hypothetical protein